MSASALGAVVASLLTWAGLAQLGALPPIPPGMGEAAGAFVGGMLASLLKGRQTNATLKEHGETLVQHDGRLKALEARE